MAQLPHLPNKWNRAVDARSKRSLNSASSGVLIVLVSQEGIRCAEPFRRRGKSGAAPATVGGEPFSKIPLGFAVQSLGRRRGARTREPGDLPERSHSFRRAGRACGADFRCGDKTDLSRAGRAAMASFTRILSNSEYSGSGPNWEVFGFDPDLPEGAHNNALEAIHVLRGRYALAK